MRRRSPSMWITLVLSMAFSAHGKTIESADITERVNDVLDQNMRELLLDQIARPSAWVDLMAGVGNAMMGDGDRERNEERRRSFMTCPEKNKKPKLKCGTMEETVDTILNFVNFNSCDAFSVEGRLQVLETAIEEVVNGCVRSAPDDGFTESNIQALNTCVTRTDDSNYDGLIPTPPDIPELGIRGDENKYGWGAHFNEEYGIGIIVHSAGGLAVVDDSYSLPTFTLRDRNGDVIYQGVYADTIESNFEVQPQTGFRSALIVDFDEESQIVTVIVASVGSIGSFLQFEFDLKAYSGLPITGLKPVRETQGFSQSVRSMQMISPDVILYAPLFDFGGGAAGEPLLRLFNWRTGTELGLSITFEPDGQDGFFEDSFIWDFKCAVNGFCWINVLEIIDPLIGTLQFNEESYGTLYTFPLSDLDPVPTIDRVIPVKQVGLQFDNEYTVLSMETLTPDTTLTCTLSGFLYPLVVWIMEGIEGSLLFDEAARSFRTSPEVLELFELGIPQQCNLCQMDLPFVSDDRRNLKEREGRVGGLRKNDRFEERIRGKDQKEKNDRFDGSLFDKIKDYKKDEEEIEEDESTEVNILSGGGSCQQVQLDGQKNTNAYIWSIEECGDKIFAGTNDLSFNMGRTMIRVVLAILAGFTCSQPLMLRGICDDDACPPENSFEANQEICKDRITERLRGFIDRRTLFKKMAALLSSKIYKEEIGTNDLGFDLFVIDKADLSSKNPTFRPVTVNGFSELSINGEADDGIRNMVCHTPSDSSDGAPTLIIASATFGNETEASSTYIMNLDEACSSILF